MPENIFSVTAPKHLGSFPNPFRHVLDQLHVPCRGEAKMCQQVILAFRTELLKLRRAGGCRG